MTVSEWYDEMFQNWWHWYKALNLKMKVVMIAEDDYIHRKYGKNSILDITVLKMSKVIYLLLKSKDAG